MVKKDETSTSDRVDLNVVNLKMERHVATDRGKGQLLTEETKIKTNRFEGRKVLWRKSKTKSPTFFFISSSLRRTKLRLNFLFTWVVWLYIRIRPEFDNNLW